MLKISNENKIINSEISNIEYILDKSTTNIKLCHLHINYDSYTLACNKKFMLPLEQNNDYADDITN